MSLLSVNNLAIDFTTRDGTVSAVSDISFTVDKGETLGIVGESGSGKSVSCYSLLGLIPMPPGHIKNGSALFDGIDLLQANEKTMRQIRGKRISMIFQDPMTSLNPYMRVGQQIIEPLLQHNKITQQAAKEKAIALLKEVGISDAANRYQQYPHEFSGGMRQRVVIAMALITEPDLLIADEPTTALDVTIQAQILELIHQLQQRRNIAVIFISHDLDVIKRMADRTIVMEKGFIVEQGNTQDIFYSPTQSYTKKLIASIPSCAKPENYRFTGDKDSRFLELNDISISYGNKNNAFKAVDNVSLTVKQGEILGLVGESGCGKTSLSHSIVRLVDIQQGQICLQQNPLETLQGSALKATRKDIQMIFQDPYASLNPRMTVFNTLAEPLRLHGIASDANELNSKVLSLMQDVGLEASWANKYPHEFSGGQRQRIAIARALAVEPQLIIADEPVSALDVTIQAQILSLLLELCQQRQLTMIFISHDLAVVRYIADRTAVMNQGKIVEINDTETVYQNPSDPYTKSLLAARV
ncbi:MAG: ABC transporter ATP-binding protein [Pseudomonadales bacterium]|nr:ABC transporter ATP-binding protein [Pseudomonadales bacterium]